MPAKLHDWYEYRVKAKNVYNHVVITTKVVAPNESAALIACREEYKYLERTNANRKLNWYVKQLNTQHRVATAGGKGK